MIGTFDKFILSEPECRKIKNLYESKIFLQESNIRKQKNYHEIDTNSWLYNLIDDFIKKKYR